MKKILFPLLAIAIICVILLGTYFYLDYQKENSSETYVGNSRAECSTIEFFCVQGYERFDDDHGCGCKPTNIFLNTTEKHFCTSEQRQAEVCTEIYSPVCGYVQVECIRAPCNPVPETFSNECFACGNERVQYFTKGEC